MSTKAQNMLENEIEMSRVRWSFYKFLLQASPYRLAASTINHTRPQEMPYISIITYIKDAYSMANKNKKSGGFREITFVQCALSVEDKKAFKSWYKNEVEKPLAIILDAQTHGYKFSSTWIDDNDCFMQALTCNDEKSPNYSQCLSARSNDFWECLALLAYKHTEMSNSGIWDFEVQANNWG